MAPIQRHVYKLFSLKRGSVRDQELTVLFLWLRTIRTALHHFVDEDFFGHTICAVLQMRGGTTKSQTECFYYCPLKLLFSDIVLPSWEYLLVLLVGLLSKKCNKIIFFMFTNFQERFVLKLCWHKPTNRSVHQQHLVQSSLIKATMALSPENLRLKNNTGEKVLPCGAFVLITSGKNTACTPPI